MMTIEEIRNALKAMNLRAVCREIWGDSFSKYVSVHKSIQGKRRAYYDDIKALSDYLNGSKL